MPDFNNTVSSEQLLIFSTKLKCPFIIIIQFRRDRPHLCVFGFLQFVHVLASSHKLLVLVVVAVGHYLPFQVQLVQVCLGVVVVHVILAALPPLKVIVIIILTVILVLVTVAVFNWGRCWVHMGRSCKERRNWVKMATRTDRGNWVKMETRKDCGNWVKWCYFVKQR